MLRWLTAGESHGPALVATLDGLPAGVEVTSKEAQAALARRRLGYGRGARMAFDADEARPILERASARETAARVALGEIAAQFIAQTTGARIVSHVVELGTV